MSAPLASVRVLDLTRLLPGALCSLFLVDLGADVLKIEDPAGGDYARWTPPIIDGLGAFFRASNRGKRSAILNLKDARGQALLQRLAAEADVLIEGFRPGVTTRLGCDYETLRAINPRLVYASLSGWGQDGPYVERGGHDLNYLALGGVLGGMRTPQPLGGQVADVGGAYAAALGIAAALFRRAVTGQGDYVDVSLFEAGLPFAMYQWVESVTLGLPGGGGSLTGAMPYYNVYHSRDDQPLALAAIEPKFWQNFCQAVDKPEWIAMQNDFSQMHDLKQQVAALFRRRTADEWEALLGDVDCCFTRIVPTEKLAEDPQVQARGMAGVDASGLPWMRSPVRLNSAGFAQAPAPEYGQHTREVLRATGLDDAEIDALHAAGVVGRQEGGA